MPMPIAIPMLYEKVIILPVASFNPDGTFIGANIIASEALSPFVMPNAATKINADVSPRMIGCDRGVQQSKIRTKIAVRIVASKIN